MDVHSKAVAEELRRRHLGRPELLNSLEDSGRSTWLPGELEKVPSSLLVLAAVSLARPEDP
ncbi:MAG TPA: hypothetical protein VMZ51_05360 [Acidimicrobiales bacterium]|nr:hypothetical protein [Acidimicrobiales bacterium]